MKNTDIHIPIFNNTYKVIVCWGTPAFIEKLGRDYGYEKGEVKLMEGSRGTTWKGHQKHQIIVLPTAPMLAAQIGTLAHEAVHAIDAMYDYMQESKTIEIHAHSVGAIVREVLTYCNDQRRMSKSSHGDRNRKNTKQDRQHKGSGTSRAGKNRNRKDKVS